jgi:hypothetical protein
VRPLNKIFSPISPSQKQIHDFYSFFTEWNEARKANDASDDGK